MVRISCFLNRTEKRTENCRNFQMFHNLLLVVLKNPDQKTVRFFSVVWMHLCTKIILSLTFHIHVLNLFTPLFVEVGSRHSNWNHFVAILRPVGLHE